MEKSHQKSPSPPSISFRKPPMFQAAKPYTISISADSDWPFSSPNYIQMFRV